MGRLTDTSLPENSSFGVTYDGNGNVIVRTDASKRSTYYTYDAADRLTNSLYPDGYSTSTTYNWRGQPLKQTDQAGNITFLVYDLAGQLSSTTTAYGQADATTTQFSYARRGGQRARQIQTAT